MPAADSTIVRSARSTETRSAVRTRVDYSVFPEETTAKTYRSLKSPLAAEVRRPNRSRNNLALVRLLWVDPIICTPAWMEDVHSHHSQRRTPRSRRRPGYAPALCSA